MLQYDVTFTVPGTSPQACFDYVTEPSNGPAWAGSAKEVTAEGDPGVGRRIIAKADLVISFEIVQTVTTYEPPSRYAFSADKPMHVAYDFTFEEAGDGTKVSCHLDADPGRFIPGGKLLLKGRFKKEFEGDMARLEKILTDL